MGPGLAVPCHPAAPAVPGRAAAVAAAGGPPSGRRSPAPACTDRRRSGSTRTLARRADVPRPATATQPTAGIASVLALGALAKSGSPPRWSCLRRARDAVPPGRGEQRQQMKWFAYAGHRYPRPAAGQYRRSPPLLCFRLSGFVDVIRCRSPSGSRSSGTACTTSTSSSARHRLRLAWRRSSPLVYILVVVGIGSLGSGSVAAQARGRTWPCPSWRPRWWRWPSSRSGNGCSAWPTGWCSASGPPRTRR